MFSLCLVLLLPKYNFSYIFHILKYTRPKLFKTRFKGNEIYKKQFSISFLVLDHIQVVLSAINSTSFFRDVDKELGVFDGQRTGIQFYY